MICFGMWNNHRFSIDLFSLFGESHFPTFSCIHCLCFSLDSYHNKVNRTLFASLVMGWFALECETTIVFRLICAHFFGESHSTTSSSQKFSLSFFSRLHFNTGHSWLYWHPPIVEGCWRTVAESWVLWRVDNWWSLRFGFMGSEFIFTLAELQYDGYSRFVYTFSSLRFCFDEFVFLYVHSLVLLWWLFLCILSLLFIL